MYETRNSRHFVAVLFCSKDRNNFVDTNISASNFSCGIIIAICIHTVRTINLRMIFFASIHVKLYNSIMLFSQKKSVISHYDDIFELNLIYDIFLYFITFYCKS